MQFTTKQLPDSKLSVLVVAEASELSSLKDHVLGHFVDRVKMPGFRQGKAPLALIEKQVDPSELHNEFLEEAINSLYQRAINEAKLRPVERPEVNIKKFVPFTTLEFEAVMTVIGEVVLPDYRKIKIPKPKISITEKDIQAVLTSLQIRLSDKKEVDRPAKTNDEMTIDFKGVDLRGQPIAGADGKDYPIILGSKSFIPGFEDNLIGLKASSEKTFELKFPKDYGAKALAGKVVKFSVKVTKVKEIQPIKIDDEFAAKAGPFKTLKELTDDVRKHLTSERQNEADRNYEAELVKQITAKSKLSVPKVLVEDQVNRTLEELKQNLVYRGQTYQEYLDLEGITDEQNRKLLTPGAEERVKAGLVLSEISEAEKVTVTPDELEARIQTLKTQYKDEQMQAELAKAEGRRDIASRMLTEKTLDKLVSYGQTS